MGSPSSRPTDRPDRRGVAGSVAVGLLLLGLVGAAVGVRSMGHRPASDVGPPVVAASDYVFVPPAYKVVGPFGPDLQAPYGPEAIDLGVVYVGADGKPARWTELAVTPGANCLDFLKLFRRDDSTGYAATAVRSPREQNGTLLMGADDTLKVWLNGVPVHEYTRPRPARPADDAVPLRWRAGTNTVLVKVYSARGDHQFFLSCVGAEGLSAVGVGYVDPLDR